MSKELHQKSGLPIKVFTIQRRLPTILERKGYELQDTERVDISDTNPSAPHVSTGDPGTHCCSASAILSQGRRLGATVDSDCLRSDKDGDDVDLDSDIPTWDPKEKTI